ncbi:MAG: serine/threonine protein kinase, partial [Anaerolineae bacterium]|nr:serine/threonine protein kinase [Anaerolineae bacterium]
GTVVAVKILKYGHAHADLMHRRFRREARLLGELQSPYVVRLLAMGDESGIAYIATEYIDGQNLSQFVRARGSLSVETSLRIISDVARALADAHPLGIIHRDIKPENILLGGPATPPDQAFEFVKLADFGLAREIDQTNSMALTRVQDFIGTPTYMAPEQWGRDPTASARADVYSLGATLYFALTG